MWLIDVADSHTFEGEDLVKISIFNVGLSTFPEGILKFKKLRDFLINYSTRNTNKDSYLWLEIR